MTTLVKRPRSYTAPAPAPCPKCGGAECRVCDFSGLESCWFRLPPSRTLAYRHCIYKPSAVGGVMKLRCSRHVGGTLKESSYTVTPFPCEWKGRAFYVCKLGAERRHEVFLGDGGCASCSCEGTTYDSAGKANQRAREQDREMFDTLGCSHLDAISRLLASGWFNIGEDK